MTLKEALINQGYEKSEAREIIAEMRDRVLEQLEDPDEVLADYGLEPDYVMELITF